MPDPQPLILGEFQRTLDQRFRLSVPSEVSDPLTADSPECILAKERSGCISLWSVAVWRAKMNVRIDLAKQKVQAGLRDDKIGQVQLLGRLLSTRHKPVQLTGRGRLLIPEGFREFLGVKPGEDGKEVMVIGAAVCVEIWNPAAWLQYLEERMPKFGRLIDQLS